VLDPVIFPELEAPYPTIHEPVSDEIPDLIPDIDLLPRFSHVPPHSIPSRDQWPVSPEAQGFPDAGTPTLLDILIWVQPYLKVSESQNLNSVATAYRFGPEFGPLWFYRPWSPYRRRRWGFGIPNKARTVCNDKPPPHLFLHFIWTYLTPSDRHTMSRTCPQRFLYHRLRVLAVKLPIANLLRVRPPPGKPSKLPLDRALLYASSLLCFGFYYGDFV
jgi:hypothetical protein